LNIMPAGHQDPDLSADLMLVNEYRANLHSYVLIGRRVRRPAHRAGRARRLPAAPPLARIIHMTSERDLAA
jgi:hypothetical protein